MNALISIPFEFRLLLTFAFGVCAGGAANWAIYALAWHPRRISPWGAPDPAAPPRRWSDRIPVLGWLALRREVPLHGKRFWCRPMLVELAMGLAFAALYWWEVGQSGLLVPGVPIDRPDLVSMFHAQYASHLVLLCLMLVASLIDFDERIIPDTITVPGVLAALLLAAVGPWSLLPDAMFVDRTLLVDFLRLTAPGRWPDWLCGRPPHVESLAIGLACWWLWCVALMPRPWHPRHGWWRAVQLSLARLRRERVTYRIVLMGLCGSAVIAVFWLKTGTRWQALLSALVGMAAAGALVWIVRVLGTLALRREAMGFGDVTLMAMLGAFLGWQPCLLIFFLAPLAGLVLGIVQLLLFRENEIPYGPFLCIAAATVVAAWEPVWAWARDLFSLGWMLIALLAVCLVLMPLLLGLWRLLRSAMR